MNVAAHDSDGNVSRGVGVERVMTVVGIRWVRARRQWLIMQHTFVWLDRPILF